MKKKKLLFCLHNFYMIKNYLHDLNKLKDKFDITILTSNNTLSTKYKINKITLKKINNIKIFIIPYYGTDDKRSLFRIIYNHIYLLKIKKKILFKDFEICISDNNFFIWQRIILENYLSKECKKLGITTGSIALNLKVFKKILQGQKLERFLTKIHKLRIYSENRRKKEKNLIKKFSNVKERFLDIIVDRVILSLLFQKKVFNYKTYDLNLMETDKFEKKIVFYYSNYLFWKQIYNKNDVILCKHENNCICNNSNKNKILFLSSFMDENFDELSNQIDRVINFFYTINKNDINKKELHIKHHPMDKNIIKINKVFKDKIKNKFKIKFIKSDVILENISCNYKIAFGMLSTALSDIKKSCKNIQVYCLKSLDMKMYGNDYFLKLLNEEIIFYDDLNNRNDINVEKFTKKIKKISRVNFSNYIINYI